MQYIKLSGLTNKVYLKRSLFSTKPQLFNFPIGLAFMLKDAIMHWIAD